MTNADQHVLVVGGGIIGIASAYYLARSGCRVTVVDKGQIGRACSYRNCGFVCPSHVLPLAEPGAIRATLLSMLRPNAAFRIRPRVDLALWRWLWSFSRRCNNRDRMESGRAIHTLLASSYRQYEELMDLERLDCEWQKQGLLFVYQKDASLEAYSATNDLLAREFNEPARRIKESELREFEPALRSGLAGAWYYEHDAHLRPERLVESWHALLTTRGVRFIENDALESLAESSGRTSATLSSGQQIDADASVIATGAWTSRLSQVLRCRIPIEPGKGYSVVVQRPERCPSVPMIFPEHRVAVTPFEQGMRIGSIMEFAGYDERISARRLKLLTDGASQYLAEPLPIEINSRWYGWRPMTYDSTPVIGRCPGFSNVFLATGHNMLGLSMAPATGRLVQELVLGSEPHLPIEPYSAERFFRR